MERAVRTEHIHRFLEKDHKTTFQKLNQFSEALTKLRYEGNQNFHENLRQIRALLGYFQKEAQHHMRLEERILFPFLEKHIPKLGPVIYMLLAEHEDFRSCLEELKDAFSRLKSAKAAKVGLVDRISERGTYFVCFSRSHLWIESQSLYRIADKELRRDEKRQLIRRIKFE